MMPITVKSAWSMSNASNCSGRRWSNGSRSLTHDGVLEEPAAWFESRLLGCGDDDCAAGPLAGRRELLRERDDEGVGLLSDVLLPFEEGSAFSFFNRMRFADSEALPPPFRLRLAMARRRFPSHLANDAQDMVGGPQTAQYNGKMVLGYYEPIQSAKTG